MSDADIPEEKMTLELVVPLEEHAPWKEGADGDDGKLALKLQLAGFDTNYPNLRFAKDANGLTVYVRGTGLPEEFQDAVMGAIDAFLLNRAGIWVKIREVRLEEL